MSRLMQQVCDQVFDKKSRKHAMSQIRTKRTHELVENLVCSWLE